MTSIDKMKHRFSLILISAASLILGACSTIQHDIVIRGGTVYDGSGSAPVVTDVAIDGDRVTSIGDLSKHRGKTEVEAKGLAVAPGFINMLSWANTSLIQDGRSMSDIYQGVTLEVMGEGFSMGPLTPQMKQDAVDRQGEKFGECLLAPEKNNHGHATIGRLKQIYPAKKIHKTRKKQVRIERETGAEAVEYGWHTNTFTKNKMLQDLAKAL